jgi:hypothetical protein
MQFDVPLHGVEPFEMFGPILGEDCGETSPHFSEEVNHEDGSDARVTHFLYAGTPWTS